MNDVDVLALLLEDCEARKLLAESPDAFCAKYQLDDSLSGFVRSLNRQQLDRQAESLLRKRLFEMKYYAPRTLAGLGDRLLAVFKSSVAKDWPEGHRRHLLDARQFIEYLKTEGFPVDDRERNRIDFLVRNRRLGLYRLRCSCYTGRGIHVIWKVKEGYRDFWYCISEPLSDR